MGILDDFTAKVKDGAYKAGTKAGVLTEETKNVLMSYADTIRSGKTVESFERHVQDARSKGMQISDAAIANGREFLSHSDIGKTISGWVGGAYDNTKGAIQSKDSFFANNRIGMLSGLGMMVTLMLLQVPALGAVALGLGAAAAGNYFGDGQNSLLASMFSTSKTAMPYAAEVPQPYKGRQHSKPIDAPNHVPDGTSLQAPAQPHGTKAPDTKGQKIP